MTKRQRCAAASLFLSGPVLASCHVLDLWTLVWIAIFGAGCVYLIKE